MSENSEETEKATVGLIPDRVTQICKQQGIDQSNPFLLELKPAFSTLPIGVLILLAALGCAALAYFFATNLWLTARSVESLPFYGYALFGFLTIAFAYLSILFFIGSANIIYLIIHDTPLLKIEAEGFRNLRCSPDLIRWSDVITSVPYSTPRGGTAGLRLQLSHPIRRRVGPLQRLFELLAMARFRSNEVFISARFLSQPRDVVMQIFQTMIEHSRGHGPSIAPETGPLSPKLMGLRDSLD